jgi:hypothetical protein
MNTERAQWIGAALIFAVALAFIGFMESLR